MLELLPLFMIISLMVLLFSGYPVALVILFVTTVFTFIAVMTGEMAPARLQLFALRAYGLLADSLIFPAVPPLIFMGVALARSGQVNELMIVISHAFRRVPGSVSIAVLLVGVLIAPSAGLIGAAVGMLSITALPSLIAQNYKPCDAAGSVAAAGTLGVILPPAIMLFFLADLVGTTILSSFTGVLLPAALLFCLYVAFFIYRGLTVLPIGRQTSSLPNQALTWLKALGPVAVIATVLGSITTGWATPSQSGSMGAAAAFLLMMATKTLSWSRFKEVCLETAYITAMVFFIIIAANSFTLIFRILDGDQMVADFLMSFGFGDWGALLFILGIIFVLGFFIDWLEIVLITLPIFMPVIELMDFTAHVGDPLLVKVWILTIIALVLQTSFVTPPFGFALFFLRGSAPPEISMSDIYRGAIPIVGMQLLVLVAVLMMPWMATTIAANFVS